MKPSFISSLTILLLAVVFPTFAQERDGQGALAFSQTPYRVGERLTYNVSFSNFPSAAHVEVEVLSRGVYFGREAIQLRAHVETAGVINVALLAINTDYITYVDPQTGLPFRSEEKARDAIKTADSVQDFNQPAGNEAISPKQKGFPGTYDFVSAFYRARALPLADGAAYNFTVRGEAVEYQAELKVVGREAIRTNVGSFPAIVTQVKVSNSPFKNFKIYFSDDEHHVPVKLVARVSAGELTAELAGSEIIKPPEPRPSPTPPLASEPLSPTAKPALSEDLPFRVGEQLNYQVFIGNNNTPLGLVSFQVGSRGRYFDRDGVNLSVNAETTGAASTIFFARDKIHSYVEPKALLPFRTEMDLQEGTRRLNQTLTVNQEAGTALTERGTRIEIPVGTHDYVSFFYALRRFNLTPKKRSAVAVLVENKPKTVFVESLQRETIQLGARIVPAIALSITTDDPQPDKYQLRMWISVDRQRMPLRITCLTQLGPLRADLAIVPTTPQ